MRLTLICFRDLPKPSQPLARSNGSPKTPTGWAPNSWADRPAAGRQRAFDELGSIALLRAHGGVVVSPIHWSGDHATLALQIYGLHAACRRGSPESICDEPLFLPREVITDHWRRP